MQQILSIASQLTPIIQAARKGSGLNQTELAGRLGLSQSRMSTMELDPATIALDQLIALCAALKLELVIQTKAAPSPAAAQPSPVEW